MNKILKQIKKRGIVLEPVIENRSEFLFLIQCVGIDNSHETHFAEIQDLENAIALHRLLANGIERNGNGFYVYDKFYRDVFSTWPFVEEYKSDGYANENEDLIGITGNVHYQYESHRVYYFDDEGKKYSVSFENLK